MMLRSLLLIIALHAWVGPAIAEDLVVIVHPERIVRLSPSDIARIFLRQRRFWEGGESIVPVNRDADSDTREAFSHAVFGDRSRSQVSFWNRQYFRGVLPPLTLASDEAVLRFVAGDTRAVGYVPSSLVDDTVREAARLKLKPRD